MKRASVLAGVCISGAALACAVLQPINSGIGRLFLITSLLAFLICFSIACRGNRLISIAFAVVILIPLALLFGPGREPDAKDLRKRYLNALQRYQGSPYVWGGEKRTGIDCSGLPRKAYRDALVEEGFWTLNGSLWREALKQWWFDASARALAGGYRGYVIPLDERGPIRNTQFSNIEPGDIAITDSGVHCLVYLEGEKWIQADPGTGDVCLDDRTKTANAWYSSPVRIYRWRELN